MIFWVCGWKLIMVVAASAVGTLGMGSYYRCIVCILLNTNEYIYNTMI